MITETTCMNVGRLEIMTQSKHWQHIVDEEINAAGSGASHECWYGGKALQTRVSGLTM